MMIAVWEANLLLLIQEVKEVLLVRQWMLTFSQTCQTLRSGLTWSMHFKYNNKKENDDRLHFGMRLTFQEKEASNARILSVVWITIYVFLFFWGKTIFKNKTTMMLGSTDFKWLLDEEETRISNEDGVSMWFLCFGPMIVMRDSRYTLSQDRGQCSSNAFLWSINVSWGEWSLVDSSSVLFEFSHTHSSSGRTTDGKRNLFPQHEEGSWRTVLRVPVFETRYEHTHRRRQSVWKSPLRSAQDNTREPSLGFFSERLPSKKAPSDQS